MNENRCDELVTSVWHFLSSFYHASPALNPLDFVRYAEHGQARVLIDESSDPDSAFVSIELPLSLRAESTSSLPVSLAALSVVSEEISHFLHYCHAAENEVPISIFELETRGEIDRFLCFLYWNDFCPEQRTERLFENCSDVYTVLFEERMFVTANEELYRDAESHALFHIRQAFAHCWGRRWLDTAHFDERARAYLLRRSFGHLRLPMSA